MTKRGLLRAVLPATAVIAAALLAPAGAGAAVSGYEEAFKVQESGSAGGQFEWGSVGDTAFDQVSHSLYVIDSGNHRVQKLDPEGHFVLAFGKNVNSNPAAASADICTAVSGDTCQAGTEGTEAGAFKEPNGIAVDSSAGPSSGDVYVSDAGSDTVSKFSAAGAYLGQVDATTTPNGAITQVPRNGGVAVDGSGHVWVVDASTDNVLEFNPDGSWAGVEWNDGYGFKGPGENFGETGGIGVNQAGTRLYLLDAQCTNSESCTYVAHSWKPDGTGESIPFEQPTGFGSAPTGFTWNDADETLYVNESDHARIYDSEDHQILELGIPNNVSPWFLGTNGSIDDSTGRYYVPSSYNQGITVLDPIRVPSIRVGAVVTGQSASGGTIEAAIDPAGGGAISACVLEWGTSNSYGNEVPCAPGGPYAAPTSVSAAVAGLTPETTYHYRFAVTGPNGTNRSSDRLFTPHRVIALSTAAATVVTPGSATLNATYTGDGGETKFRFEWGTTNKYGSLTPEQTSAATGPETLSAAISGLNPYTVYHYRVVATNAAGTSRGQDVTLTTARDKPHVSSSVSDVHSDSAILHGTVNPAGANSTYRFEWGESASYGSASEDKPVPSATLSSEFSLQLSGLEQGTIYHYRIVAENSKGTTEGDDHVFSTFGFDPVLKDPCQNAHERQQTGAALLLDCRAYELVSAAYSGGYDIESNLVPGQSPYGGYPLAGAPSRVLYSVHQGGIPGSGNPVNYERDPYLATRTDRGWTTSYVGIPADGTPDDGAFSSAVSAAGAGLGSFAFGAPDSCSPCFADGSTGIPVRLPDGNLVQGMAGSMPVADPTAAGFVAKEMSADGNHLVFGSSDEFEPGGSPGGAVSIYERDLQTGITHLVSKTPAGTTMTGPGIAELDLSADGGRVLVGQKTGEDAKGNDLYHLFMNVGGADRTIEITPGGAIYAGMTADGSTVFVLTAESLEPADTDGDLDLYSVELDAGGITSTNLLSGPTSGSCEPQGHWNSAAGVDSCDALAISGGGGVASGSGAAYFLSPEQLDGAEGVVGAPNLYLASPGAPPRFVATLSTSDPVVADSLGDAAARRSADFEVTPDGRFAAFGSSANLTSFDGVGHREIYRYDSLADVVGTSVVCASCAPTGARPSTDATMASDGLSLADDGRVFFESGDPLAARDLDGVVDVYEWEKGIVQLISTGSSLRDSGLLSASADGTDVYFFIRDQLAKEDQNGSLVRIYDARELGGFPFQPPPVPCKASDECVSVGSPPPPPPEVRTQHGSGGNVRTGPAKGPKHCGKGKTLKKGKCVKKPKKKKKSRRHAHKSGGGSR